MNIDIKRYKINFVKIVKKICHILVLGLIFVLLLNVTFVLAKEEKIIKDFTEQKIRKGITPPGYLPVLCPSRCKSKKQKKKKTIYLKEADRFFINAYEIRNNNGILTAIGDVEAKYGEIKVIADKIEFNQKSRDLWALGKVTLYKGRDKISGSQLSYNLDNNKAYLKQAYGILYDIISGNEEYEGSLFVWGDEIEWDKDIIHIKNGTFTSCDIPAPDYHYHLTGDEIIIEPSKKIRIKKARVFYKKSQVLGINSLVVPLNRRGIRFQSLFIPKIGRNTIEGEYFKESANYLWGDKDYGSIYLDYYRKIGLGYGLQHYYHFNDEKGAGKIYYYNLGSNKTVANRYNLQNRIYYQFSKSFFASADYTAQRYSFPGFTSPPIKNAELYAHNITSESENIFRGKRYIFGKDKFTSFNLANRFFINDNLRSDLIMDYLYTDSTISDQYRLNTLARLAYKGDVFDGNLEFDYTTGNRNFYVNRLPEAKLKSHPFKLGVFEGRVSLGAGNFMEMPSGINALRSDLKLSILNKVFKLGESGKLSFAAGGRQFIYGTGDRKYQVRSRLALEQDIFDNFTFLVSHNFQDNNGYSPLAVDYFDDYHMLGTTLAFHKSKKFRLQVTGGYDLNKKLFQTIIPQMEICPSKNSSILIGSTYDKNNHTWMNAVGEFGIKLTPQLSFKYWGLYDIINKKMSYQNYLIQLSSHDFVTRLIYKSSQGELWLDVNLKILPSEDKKILPDSNEPIIQKNIYDGAPDEPKEELL